MTDGKKSTASSLLFYIKQGVIFFKQDISWLMQTAVERSAQVASQLIISDEVKITSTEKASPDRSIMQGEEGENNQSDRAVQQQERIEHPASQQRNDPPLELKQKMAAEGLKENQNKAANQVEEPISLQEAAIQQQRGTGGSKKTAPKTASVGKRRTHKKSATKKPVTKKTAAKKVVTKKAAAKKAASKKTVNKKPAAKKGATKKTVKKRAAGKKAVSKKKVATKKRAAAKKK